MRVPWTDVPTAGQRCTTQKGKKCSGRLTEENTGDASVEAMHRAGLMERRLVVGDEKVWSLDAEASRHGAKRLALRDQTCRLRDGEEVPMLEEHADVHGYNGRSA